MRLARLFIAGLYFSGMLFARETGQSSTSPPTRFCYSYFGGGAAKSTPSVKTTPESVPDAEMSRIEKSRACMIRFPWVRPPDWPPGKEYHGERVNADQMRQIRDSIDEYRISKYVRDPIQDELARRDRKQFDETHVFGQDKYPAPFQALLELNNPKIDLIQYLLFADFLLLSKLEGEGRYEEARTEAERIIDSRHMRFEAVPWTEADQLTYVSTENLENLILLRAAEIRVKTKVKSPSDEFSFLLRYLEARSELTNVFGRLGLTDQTNQLLRRVAKESWYALDQPSWIRSDKLSNLQYVVGASSFEGGYMVVFRGKRVYSIEVSKERNSVRLLDGKSAADAYARVLDSDLDTYSSPEGRLFVVSKFEDKYEIKLAGEHPLFLSEVELSTLKAGKSLSQSHDLSKALKRVGSAPIVLYTNPLTLLDTVQTAVGDEVAYAIQRGYPESTVVLDPLSEDTMKQIAKLRELGISEGAKVTALVAEKTFAVKDFKLVQNIEEQLIQNGIEVVRVGRGQIHWTADNGRIVLVVTGHIDSQLASFVRALGDAGVLGGNYVIFNSCRATLSRQLATEMTTRYRAIAVFTYDSKITPEQLEPTLIKTPARIEEESKTPFLQFWRKAIREQKLSGVWTVCWRIRLLGGAEA